MSATEPPKVPEKEEPTADETKPAEIAGIPDTAADAEKKAAEDKKLAEDTAKKKALAEKEAAAKEAAAKEEELKKGGVTFTPAGLAEKAKKAKNATDDDTIGAGGDASQPSIPKVEDTTDYNYRGYKTMMGQVWSAILDTFKSWPLHFVYFAAVKVVATVDSVVRGPVNYGFGVAAMVPGLFSEGWAKDGLTLRERGREMDGTLPFIAECIAPWVLRQTLGRVVNLLSFNTLLKDNSQEIDNINHKARRYFKNSVVCKTQNLLGKGLGDSAQNAELRIGSIINDLLRFKFSSAFTNFIKIFGVLPRYISSENPPGFFNKLYQMITNPMQWPGLSLLGANTRDSEGVKLVLEGSKTRPKDFSYLKSWFGTDDLSKIGDKFLPYWLSKASARGDLADPNADNWCMARVENTAAFIGRNALKFGKWIGNIVSHHLFGTPLATKMPNYREGDKVVIEARQVAPADVMARVDDTKKPHFEEMSHKLGMESKAHTSTANTAGPGRSETVGLEERYRNNNPAPGPETPGPRGSWRLSFFNLFRSLGLGWFAQTAKQDPNATAKVGLETKPDKTGPTHS